MHCAIISVSLSEPYQELPPRSCLGIQPNSIYNRIFARSRTPKCAKLVLGASAVHVRSRLCSRFFGVAPPKNEKRAVLCEKGAYCELASSLSSLDTACSFLQPFGAFMVRQAMRARGGGGGLRAHRRGGSSGHNSRDTDFSVRYLRRASLVVVLFLFIVVARSLSSSPSMSRARLRFLPAAVAHGMRMFDSAGGS